MPELSYASSGSKMKFIEDFYAVTIVSYIYYEEDQIRDDILEGEANENNSAPYRLDRDLLIDDPVDR
jgi:hypothetical protein